MGISVWCNLNYNELTCFKLFNDVMIYDISCIGFHDKFIINFYKFYKHDTDLNKMFD
jgi:hypothetical protein